MFEVVQTVIVTVVVIGIPTLGVLAVAWDGSKENRLNFWVVFVPCQLLLLAIAFIAGRMAG